MLNVITNGWLYLGLLLTLASLSCATNQTHTLPEEVALAPIQISPDEICREARTWTDTDETKTRLAHEAIRQLNDADIFSAYGCYHYLNISRPPYKNDDDIQDISTQYEDDNDTYDIPTKYKNDDDIQDISTQYEYTVSALHLDEYQYTVYTQEDLKNDKRLQEIVSSFKNTPQSYDDDYMYSDAHDEWEAAPIRYSPYYPLMADIAIRNKWIYMIIRLQRDVLDLLDFDVLEKLYLSVTPAEYRNYLTRSQDIDEIRLITSIVPAALESSPNVQALARKLEGLLPKAEENIIRERMRTFKPSQDESGTKYFLTLAMESFLRGNATLAFELGRRYAKEYAEDSSQNTSVRHRFVADMSPNYPLPQCGWCLEDIQSCRDKAVQSIQPLIHQYRETCDIMAQETTNPSACDALSEKLHEQLDADCFFRLGIDSGDDEIENYRTRNGLSSGFRTERMMPPTFGKYPTQALRPFPSPNRDNRYQLPLLAYVALCEQSASLSNKKACERRSAQQIATILRWQMTTLEHPYRKIPTRQLVHDANFLHDRQCNKDDYKDPNIPQHKDDLLVYARDFIRASQTEPPDDFGRFILLITQLLNAGLREEAVVVASASFSAPQAPPIVNGILHWLEGDSPIPVQLANIPEIACNAPLEMLRGKYVSRNVLLSRTFDNSPGDGQPCTGSDILSCAASGAFDYTQANKIEKGLVAEIALFYGNYAYAEELSRDLPIAAGDSQHKYIFKRVHGLALVGLRRFDEAFNSLNPLGFSEMGAGDPCNRRPTYADDFDYHWRVTMEEIYEITGQTPRTLIAHPDPELAAFYLKINRLRRRVEGRNNVLLTQEACLLAQALNDDATASGFCSGR